jgi:hypothetical protein
LFQKLDLFPSSDEEKDISTFFLNTRFCTKSKNPVILGFYSPTSDSFGIKNYITQTYFNVNVQISDFIEIHRFSRGKHLSAMHLFYACHAKM